MKKVLDRVGETEKKTVFEGVGWGEKKAASKFFIRPAETSFKPRRSTVTLGFVALRYERVEGSIELGRASLVFAIELRK